MKPTLLSLLLLCSCSRETEMRGMTLADPVLIAAEVDWWLEAHPEFNKPLFQDGPPLPRNYLTNCSLVSINHEWALEFKQWLKTNRGIELKWP